MVSPSLSWTWVQMCQVSNFGHDDLQSITALLILYHCCSYIIMLANHTILHTYCYCIVQFFRTLNKCFIQTFYKKFPWNVFKESHKQTCFMLLHSSAFIRDKCMNKCFSFYLDTLAHDRRWQAKLHSWIGFWKK